MFIDGKKNFDSKFTIKENIRRTNPCNINKVLLVMQLIMDKPCEYKKGCFEKEESIAQIYRILFED